MKRTIIYVGLDVDDTQCHGSAFNETTGEVILKRRLRTRPTGQNITMAGWNALLLIDRAVSKQTGSGSGVHCKD